MTFESQYPRQHPLFRHHKHGLVIKLDYKEPWAGKVYVRPVELLAGSPHGFVPRPDPNGNLSAYDLWVFENDLYPADRELDLLEAVGGGL